MRIRIYPILVISMLLFVNTVCSQELGDTIQTTSFDRGFAIGHFQDKYKSTPSMLSYWNLKDWSYIGSSYDFASGNFRNNQSYNKLSGFNLNTESVARHKESGWSFYGMFSYTNGNADSIHNNMSFKLPENGSPIYHFLKVPGQWKFQRYEFNAIAAKQLSNKFSIGTKINYDGDLAFRQNDTRNNQTTLRYDLTFSGTYNINEENRVSLGAIYSRSKEEPNFSNKFQHESNDLSYNRYLNSGLGSYVKNVNFPTYINEFTYSALLQWSLENRKNRYSAIIKGTLGNDYVVNKDIRNIQDQNRILKYDYKKAELLATSLNKVGKNYLYTKIEAILTKGSGSMYNDVNRSYLSNYEATITSFKLNVNYMDFSSLVNKLNFDFGIHKEKRFDKNFGYTFNWFNMYAGLGLLFSANIGQTNIKFGAGSSYHKNIDYKLDPNAASQNLYTDWIANPYMTWLTTDYLDIPATINCTIPTGKSQVEININGGMLKPLQIKHISENTFKTDDNFLYIKSSVKFYF